MSDLIWLHDAVNVADMADYTGLSVEDVKKVTDEVVKGLKALPIVDAVPVVHGYWIDMGDFEQCSTCKGTRLKEFNSFYGKVTWIRTAYCSHCGARMDEVTES